MDFDFPLILMVATFLSGAIVLLDQIWLKKRRLIATGMTEADHKEREGEDTLVKTPYIIEQARSFFPVLAVVFVLRSFIAEPFQIPSGSMEPGLIAGDFIVVSKFHYGLRAPVFGNTLVATGEPKRGDVMVFFPPNDPRYFIKRVIGLPGDTVIYRDRRLTINGEEVPLMELFSEPDYRPVKFLANETFGETTAAIQWLYARDRRTQEKLLWAGPEGEWQVPDGHYFMLGDNRGNSGDSRVWGFVPEENIVGKAMAVWMHWESWSELPSFGRNQWIQ